MITKQTLTLLATAAFFGIATVAVADNNTNNGAGNTITDNSGIGNGNTTVTSNTNSNNPSLSATGGTSSATGGNASATGGAGGTASANSRNSNRQAQGQSQRATSSVRSSGNSSNSYVAQAQARNPVSTAFAAPLTAAEDTCMGSSSAGGQGVGFGLSLGTTWHDKDCVRRKNARELYNMHQQKAALALLCQSEDVAQAMTTAGTPCPGRDAELVSSDEHISRDSDRIVAQNPSTEGVISEYPTQARRW
jgi:hypothetical protein